jgi:hypothetical protein
MIVYIGNLHVTTSEHDINRLARLPEGCYSRLIKKPDGHGGLHCYGLVYVPSERKGLKLIKRVHGKICCGNRLVAREFGQRMASNERRRLDWREVPWHGLEERRRCERRTAEG